MKDGLLGFLDSPAGAGLLSAVAGGLAGARRGTPLNNIGRGGLAGLAGYAQANEDGLKMAELKRLNEMRDLQQQQGQLQLQQAQRGFDRDKQIEDAAKSAFRPPTTGSLGFGAALNSPQSQQLIEQVGTNDEAFNTDMLKGLNGSLEFSNPGQAVPAQAPSAGGFDNKVFLDKYRQIEPLKAIQYEQALKKENAPVKVGKDDRLVDPTSYKELVGAAPEKIDYNKPFLPDGTPNLAYQKFKLSDSRSGAPSVSVNTGQKGLENELKFSSSFKGEPIYKAHQDVQSAHGQITKALELKSPAGDLAGATKLMKILDPGSVVRESELALAMSASGALDRLTNYGNAVITGQKLTPTQRADFKKLADELSGESVKQYNSKRDEYKTFADGYGLNSDVLLGKPAQNKQDSKTSEAKTFDAKPPAQQFKGKLLTSPDGKRYQSDGLTWKEVK